MKKHTEQISELYYRHDQMFEGSGKVVVLPRKISPSGQALLDDIGALLELPAASPVVEVVMRKALSEIAEKLLKPT